MWAVESRAAESWLLGGGMVGALCYVSWQRIHAGGNYHYLQRAFGKNFSPFVSWARVFVIRKTGSIALLAFVFGDYTSQLFPR